MLADYITAYSPVSVATSGRIANCAANTTTSPLCSTPTPTPTKSTLGLRIVHINDPHARIDPADSNFNLVSPANYYKAYGGLARMATYIAQARADAAAAGQDILVLHGGDQYTGTPWDSIYTQKNNFTIAQMLNMIGFDAMVRASVFALKGGARTSVVCVRASALLCALMQERMGGGGRR